VASPHGPVLVLSPISLLKFVKITNLKDVPLRIDSYSLEEQVASDQWVPVTVVTAKRARFIFRIPGTTPLEWGLTNSLDDVIDGKYIEPHKTVEGWLAAVCLKDGIHEPWRIIITDSAGIKYVGQIKSVEFSEHDISLSDLSRIQTIDITSFPIVPYAPH
jgi:hypothetical protein